MARSTYTYLPQEVQAADFATRAYSVGTALSTCNAGGLRSLDS